MARNESNKYKNRHAFYVGMSGTGKTVALMQNPDLLKAKKLIYWDPFNDHPARERYSDPHKFIQALRLKRPTFSVAYTRDNTRANFEFFCKQVWLRADGKEPIVVVCEEVGDACNTTGQLDGYAGKMWRVGRKYGLIILAANQRIAEVPKTVISQSQHKYVMRQDLDIDLKRAADYCNRTAADIQALKDLEYYYKIPGADPVLKKAKIPRRK